MMKELMIKLGNIQTELKAPKSQFNNFGKYKYRNCEDIQEAVKPLLHKEGLVLTLSDKIELIGNRFYVVATATITDGENALTVQASAREEDTKKGMDQSQITGAASSYARKYALSGLFLIDDTKDADSNETRQEEPKKEPAKELPAITQVQMDKAVERLKAGEKILDSIKSTFKLTHNELTYLESIANNQNKK